MSSFTESNLAKKLGELNNTQQSIQTLSLWLIHHRKHSKTIIQVWYKEMQKVSSARRLTLMYLANDVIQNSKKKGPEFTRDFGTILADAFKVATKDVDDKVKGSLNRILKIWEERGVYSKEFLKQVRTGAGSAGIVAAPESSHSHSHKNSHSKSASRRSPAASQGDTEVTPRKKKKKEEPVEAVSLKQEVDALKQQEIEHVDAEDLVKKLSELENSASSDAAVREKIAALPPEVSDISQLGKIHDKDTAKKLSNTVDDACILLSEYNKRLTEELDERKDVAKMLRGFILAQKDQLEKAETKLQEYKDKLAKVTTVRQELKSHLQNLPDLTLLPDVTGGLAPLPSAGDLFH